MQTEDLITTGEAAKIAGVSVKTFIRWATVEPTKIRPAQKLPGLRGAYLFDREEVATLGGVA